MSSSRRQFLALSAGALAAPSVALAENASIKFGAVLAQQGSFSLYGEAAALGAQVALNMVDNTVLGRRVQLVRYDDPNPLGAQQNMSKLIQQDQVCAVIGGMTSASASAIAALGAQSKIPTIVPMATVREITGADCSPYVFRVNGFTEVYTRNDLQHFLSIGKKWYFLVGGYSYGQEVYKLMKGELDAAGGSEVGMDAAAVGTSDFSSIILKIRQASPDLVVIGIAGQDLAAFLKQYGEFGLEIPLGGVAVTDEDLWTLPANPPKLLTGKFWHYNNPLNTPEESAVNEASKKATGHPATQACVAGWISMRMILAAVQEAGSTEANEIVRALERVEPTGVRGKFRAWDHQMLWQPIICEARKKITDKYDPVVVLESKMTASDLDHLYGTREQSRCNMARI
jgi:branched-chain amino acid transport system substrate-binding protein